uniref:Uncharacterized protein n=1 Tax=Glossina brevipalpis TaxID=37001 RepID=A0A1A9WGW6_9MUSC
MSQTKTAAATFLLLIFFYNIAIVTQAVMVERNVYAYYRLPTSIIETSNFSQTFYVLQCPYLTGYSIPRPLEMAVCAIVGRYQEVIKQKNNNSHRNERKNMQQFQPIMITIQPKKKKKQILKIIKIKKIKPQIQLMRQFPKSKQIKEHNDEMKPRRRQQEPLHDQQIQISNLRPIKMRDRMNETIKEFVNISTETPANGTVDYQDHYPDDPGWDNERSDNSEELDFVDVQEDTSPLRFLSVKNALSELKLKKPADILPDDSYGNSEKFFAEINDFGRGFHTKGYHNMYHRDEILNDHIIYDDLHQTGNYKHKQKLKEKF